MANKARKPEYKSWHGMIRRCENPADTKYALYGGRGIIVCERWHSFELFLKDMGDRPSGTTLDRFPDKNGNYGPSNCRWATMVEQNRNKRTNRLLTYKGETRTISEWSERTGLKHSLILKRINKGWDATRTFETLVGNIKSHCPKGHPYSGENIFVRKSGRRECRECMRERCRARRIALRPVHGDGVGSGTGATDTRQG